MLSILADDYQEVRADQFMLADRDLTKSAGHRSHHRAASCDRCRSFDVLGGACRLACLHLELVLILPAGMGGGRLYGALATPHFGYAMIKIIRAGLYRSDGTCASLRELPVNILADYSTQSGIRAYWGHPILGWVLKTFKMDLLVEGEHSSAHR